MEREQLVFLIQKNDREARHILFREFYRKAYAAAYYITGDRHFSEDLTQDAFIKAFNNLERLQNPEKFGAWLASITANLARDYLARRRRMHPTAEVGRLADPVGGDAGETLLQREEQETMRSLLRKLPAEQRQVVFLRYYQEMSMEEIAGCLDIQIGTVKSRLHRAKKKLAAMLREPKSGPIRHISSSDPRGKGGEPFDR